MTKNVETFEEIVAGSTGGKLHSADLAVIQVNVGLRCNQSCAHCHLECSPTRTEVMQWPEMEGILEAAEVSGCRLVDVTGGAPELNPDFCRFIEALCLQARNVQVRTNLTVLLEPYLEHIPEFFREHQVSLVASMPCYLEENVRTQRGAGVYEKSLEAIRKLNSLGYGTNDALSLNLVYNPGSAFLPSDQEGLEKDYRRELAERHGVRFSRLLTITNMPVGRFLKKLRGENKYVEYMKLLRESFNPDTVEGLMCRHQISVGWDGILYDCDFNLALRMPVDHGAPSSLANFNPDALRKRRIITGTHCFGCTAGCGSSCGGALV